MAGDMEEPDIVRHHDTIAQLAPPGTDAGKTRQIPAAGEPRFQEKPVAGSIISLFVVRVLARLRGCSREVLGRSADDG
jgi:hypothetical protein